MNSAGLTSTKDWSFFMTLHLNKVSLSWKSRLRVCLHKVHLCENYSTGSHSVPLNVLKWNVIEGLGS